MKVFVDLYDKGYLPRQLHGQLGPGLAVGDLRPRGRGPRGHGHALLHRLPARGRRAARHRRHRAAGDDAGRHRRRGEPGRRALPRPRSASTAILPLVGRRLPIIADDYVKPEFGTGALKITPGHDPNDFEIGRRHGLEEISVIGEDGRMTEAAGALRRPHGRRGARGGGRGARAGGPRSPSTSPTRTRCRSRTAPGERDRAADLAAVVLRMDELAAPAIEAVESGRVRFHPERWEKRVPRLAREHPAVVHLAPAVVGAPAAGLVLRRVRGDLRRARSRRSAAAPATASCAATRTCSTPGSRSALWPFATLGWPDDTPELRAFYPTDFLVTARDIIFLWVARMVMMGLEFPGDVPFDDVYITSIIQAPDGRRMSKSLGTGHRPARRDRGARRGRGALRAAGDVVVPGRALLGREDPAGPAARQQDVERVAAGAD